MEVLCCVLVLRAIAATHVATVKAHAQVNPGVANLKAIFATLCAGLNIADGIEMRALL